MRVILLAAATAVVAGCASKKVETPPPAPQLTRTDCYTVVLFDDVEIAEPSDAVPAQNRAFLGHWQKGAWAGKWCHDILVSAVHEDGTAEIFDMHAPYDPWNQPATAFKRRARIDDKGTLRFRHGNESRSYRIVDGRLHAKRSGQLGDHEAVLVDTNTATAMTRATTQVAEASVPAPGAAPQPVTAPGLSAIAPVAAATPEATPLATPDTQLVTAFAEIEPLETPIAGQAVEAESAPALTFETGDASDFFQVDGPSAGTLTVSPIPPQKGSG